MPVIFTLPEKKTRDLRKSGQRKVQWRRKQIEGGRGRIIRTLDEQINKVIITLT